MRNPPNPGEDDAAGRKASNWPEQLAVRAAWYYYVLGLTQQQVAMRLDINRVRVNRLLAEARRRGVVEINIRSKLVDNIDLEARLCDRFALNAAFVAPTLTENKDRLSRIVGEAGVTLAAAKLCDGVTIGVGWGVTVKALATKFPNRKIADAAVISMQGTFSRRSSRSIFETATDLAERIHAECYYLPGPIICDSEESRDIVMEQPLVREVYQRLAAADLAIFSVGGLDSATIRRMGFVTDEENRSAVERGAVGNFLGHYVDDRVEIVNHPVNRRVIGFHPSGLLGIPDRIMISGGKSKVAALSALLRRGYATEFATDAETARAVLANP